MKLRHVLVLVVAAPLAAALAPSAFAAPSAPALTGYVQRTSVQYSVPPSTQIRATVRCPAGTNVIGGGALLTDTASTEGLNTSAPVFDGKTWAVRVNNTDENMFAHVRVRAVCAAGIANYQVIEGVGVDNPGRAVTSAQALCPSGTAVLGGGGNLTSPELAVYLASSRPIARGWRVTAANANPTADNFVMPYAICGQKPAGWQQVVGTPSTLKPFSQGQAAVACPAGTSVLSGGGQSSSNSQSVSLNSSTPVGSDIWQVFENNIANVTNRLTAYAICASV